MEDDELRELEEHATQAAIRRSQGAWPHRVLRLVRMVKELRTKLVQEHDSHLETAAIMRRVRDRADDLAAKLAQAQASAKREGE